MGAVVITSVSPLAVRCAAVVVGVRGCRDVIFEEALDITGGGDRMAGPTVLAPIMPPSPPAPNSTHLSDYGVSSRVP